jgi:hypothetical protein
MRRLWAERDHPWPTEGRWGAAAADFVKASAKRLDDLEPSVVDTWIAVLDEYQSWLISLYAAFRETGEKRGQLSDFEKSITILLSKIIGDTFALRMLAKGGFDTASQPILRSVAEYLEVLVAIIDDPTFSSAFIASDTPEGAKSFWEQNLRGGRIRRRIRKAWTRFFGRDDETTHFWADWGHADFLKLSGLAHPSFAGGLFTAIPMKTKHIEENWLGLWGDRSEATSETIFTFSKFMLPLLLLNSGFPFEHEDSGCGSITYNPDDESHIHVKIGRSVLASVVISLGEKNNHQHIFPEYDLSIFSED